MAIVLISAVLMLLAVYGSIAYDIALLTQAHRLAASKEAQAVVSKEVNRYFQQNLEYPASLSVLAQTEGFTHLAPWVSTSNGGTYPSSKDLVIIERANNLSDSNWEYQRVAVVSLTNRSEALTDYFSSGRNECGASDFYSNATWCGATDSNWTRYETRELASQVLGSAYQQQNRTLQKFIRYYERHSNFPGTIGATVALHTMAGATPGGYDSCIGSYTWDVIPFECQDFYNYFGNDVYFQKISKKHIRLTSTTGSLLRESGGNSITLVTDVQIP